MAAKVPATGGTLAVVSLLLAILTVFTVVVNGQIVFPEDERGVRECGVGEVCVAKDSCLEYKKKLQQRGLWPKPWLRWPRRAAERTLERRG